MDFIRNAIRAINEALGEWWAGPVRAEDIQCPVCGYLCLGKGGMGCIDKPHLVEVEKKHGP